MNQCCPYMYTPYYGYYYQQRPYCYSMCNSAPVAHPSRSCQHKNNISTVSAPQELSVDGTSSPKSVFVGGVASTTLLLEYLGTGPSPTIKLSITEAGNTTTWDINNITDEYQIKADFTTLTPGAKMSIELIDAFVRLRWCEEISH